MATLTVAQVSTAGIVDPTPVAAAAGGDQFTNNGRTFLKVVNGSGGAITVTVAAQATCDQGSTHNVANSVSAGATELMGPFSSRYTDANGFCQVTYSGVTSLTVAAISV